MSKKEAVMKELKKAELTIDATSSPEEIKHFLMSKDFSET